MTLVAEMSGGLGNQLFQWAFAYGLATRLGRKLIVDRTVKQVGVTREYTLDKLGIPGENAPHTEDSIYNVISRDGYETVGSPLRDVVRIKGLRMDEGPWQHAAGAIRERLSFPRANPWGVAVHVRRTDFHNSPMEVLPIEYYQKALTRVPNVPRFVFSDDPDWCNANGLGPVVDETDPIRALKLMASCKHHIIANSSFSWWAAWLGESEGQVVVAPAKWLKGNDAVTKQIIPQRWLIGEF